MAKTNTKIRIDKFLSHVNVPENKNDCWEWTGHKFPTGYGCFGRHSYAHRISFELFIGLIPEGLFVCHSCDNKACVNPAHLWLGTHQDNMDDKVKKNRQLRGENHCKHKLNEQNIYEIRKMKNQGYKQKDIASIFGVGAMEISRIISGKRWGWLK